MKFVSALSANIIYVFRINDEAHKGCLKIGETTLAEVSDILSLAPNSRVLNEAAKHRINQYTQTAGISYDLLHTELTINIKNRKVMSFTDGEVHRVLDRSGIKRKVFDKQNKANEWFITDLETVKKAITAVKEGRDSLQNEEISEGQNPIIFRPEQQDAIKKTIKQFEKQQKMLWYAKMRFGKTLSALQVIKEIGFEKTLILTHRPVVDAGWFEDFNKIFYDSPEYFYGSKNKGNSFNTLTNRAKKGNKIIYFASMQDLRGSELVGGIYDKNEDIYAMSWDLIIVDEAHEGTQTELGQSVMKELTKPTTKILELSGTPFNLLDEYDEAQIYTWDYVMEQRAKAEWDSLHFGDPNPYASLPRMNIFTYDLGKLLKKYIDEDIAFNFREFFRVNEDGSFIHEKDVLSFLNLITQKSNNTNYPFSTEEYRANFRHSLWMVPGVKEAKALSTLLKSHDVFSLFDVVNVAGEGDEEESFSDALKKVRDAIGENSHETYTITLSCGRLTTGVSVPEWTAVFMLAGSFNTAASAYMQTIFRVQTPATINGRIKEECYVFDFAPDRTLRVIAETAKISAKAGETSGDDRKIMGEFINFCPIIGVDGSRMQAYDVNSMLEQLKRAFVDRVVRNGFEDGYLYNNDQLMKLDGLELSKFDKLKAIIGSTKAMAKTRDIDINVHGFTEEEYETLKVAEKKQRQKLELSEEEKALLEERRDRKKQRDAAISILRGISIRMPLLIYGAELTDEDTELDIDNFSSLVDDQSWEEFMPDKVSKEMFEGFKKYYEPDVFRAAGKKIRTMARAADNLCVEERIERISSIFTSFRNPDKETVLTPWRVVNMHMSDCLGGWTFFDDKFEKPIEEPRLVDRGDVTQNVFASNAFNLEINSKSGLYSLYLAYSIYRNRLGERSGLTLEEEQQLWDSVVAENLFIIGKTPMAKSIARRTLIGFRDAKVNTRYFEDLVNQITHKPDNFIRKIKQGKTYWKTNNIENMKFNAIVGNPPYQVMDGGNSASAKPVYNFFYDISTKLKPDFVSLIIPARWYAGGKGLDDFRTNVLQSEQLLYLHDFNDSSDLFPGVSIAGGICYFLWKDNYKGNCTVFNYRNNKLFSTKQRDLNSYSIFIRDNKAIDILEKATSIEAIYMNTVVYSRNSFSLASNVRGFDTKRNNTFKLLSTAGISYIKADKITDRFEILNKQKVVITYAMSGGHKPSVDGDYQVVSSLRILGPNEVCTETFLVINAYESKSEADNLVKYIKTKFFRFLLLQSLSSIHITKQTFQFVPLQDFTSESDIDWGQSIEEIDRQLYQKYQLNSEEIEFIESMIKPMD